MHHNFIRGLRRVARVSLAPVIADSIREDVSIPVERRGGNGSSNIGITLETVLGVLVPEVERAVTSSGAKRAVLGVEGNRVQRVNVADVSGVAWRFAVAFETEVRAVIFFLDVLDSAAAFDTTNCKASGVPKTTNRSRLPFQG